MLKAKDIVFSYARRRILDGVAFSVASGEIVALVGTNGAGKTTLMRVLAGLLMPTSGGVLADDFDAFREPQRFRRALGYLPERVTIDETFTVRGYLTFRAQLRGEQNRKIRHRVQEALVACRLEELADVRIARLSNGQRRLVALADALLLRPRFLLADDLFAGVDPAARAALGQTIASYSQFASVVVSGHEVAEFGTFATRFLVLDAGRVSVVKGADEARKALLA